MFDPTAGKLASIIRVRAKEKARYVIAVSGFGGSGKSTLAHQLAAELKDAVVISLDEFILHRLTARSSDWDGFDWPRLIDEVLEPVAEGAQNVNYGVYDWKRDSVSDIKTLALPKYVIVEGVALLKEALRGYFDLSIWLDVPLGVASERGKKRDREEYHTDHDELWDTLWTLNDKDYSAKHHPQNMADIVVTNT